MDGGTILIVGTIPSCLVGDDFSCACAMVDCCLSRKSVVCCRSCDHCWPRVVGITGGADNDGVDRDNAGADASDGDEAGAGADAGADGIDGACAAVDDDVARAGAGAAAAREEEEGRFKSITSKIRMNMHIAVEQFEWLF